MTTIGFIGAGQLGEPMVRRLLLAGHHIAAYARRDDVRSRLRDAGATLADSTVELAAASDVLISCLFSDAQLRETAMGPDGFIAHAKPGSVFVSHTTGSVDTLRELEGSCPSPPAIVDAPVSGTADDIAQGTLTVLIGGAPDAVQLVRAIVAAYADPVMSTGGLGSALTVKLINNLLFAANAQLVATAVNIGERLGIVPDVLLDALSVCSGNSHAAAAARRAGGIEGFEELAAPFLRKDVAVAVAAAREADTDLGLLGSVVETGPLRLA